MKRQTKNNIKMWAQRQKHLSPQSTNLFLYSNAFETEWRRRTRWPATMHYNFFGHYAENVSSFGRTTRIATDSNKCSEQRPHRHRTSHEHETQRSDSMNISWRILFQIQLRIASQSLLRAQSSSSSSVLVEHNRDDKITGASAHAQKASKHQCRRKCEEEKTQQNYIIFSLLIIINCMKECDRLEKRMNRRHNERCNCCCHVAPTQHTTMNRKRI